MHEEPPRLRADATRNRDAILAAAKEIFAERGIEASLEEIAARARVGIATLYRRFPSRQDLVAAALIEKVAEFVEAAQAALALPDAWEGFCCYVRTICELQAGDRGLADLLSMTLPADEHVERLRQTANDHVVELIGRAKAAGQLRADFVKEDLLVLLIANAALVHVTRAEAPGASRRLVALALDAFGRTDVPSALPAPPSSAEMASAMCSLARERGCGTSPPRSSCSRSDRSGANPEPSKTTPLKNASSGPDTTVPPQTQA